MNISKPNKIPNRVCLGMPLYNQTRYLTEALNSIIDQSYKDFQLIIIDDSNISEPGQIVKKTASCDNRIHYFKNKSRKGLVANWKACFQYADRAEYFAWVSDHDLWHPNWLETMVHALDANPSALLACPQTVCITKAGEKLCDGTRSLFSTLGMSEKQRVKAICEAKGFGNMVYGLFRADAIRQAGIFRRVLFPDVILIHEISLRGDIMQIDEDLWYRRKIAEFSIDRQKRTLFTKKPWHIFLPWLLVNASVIAWQSSLKAHNANLRRRLLGLEMAFRYLIRWLDMLGFCSQIGSVRQWYRVKAPWMKRLKTSFKKELRLGKYKKDSASNDIKD